MQACKHARVARRLSDYACKSREFVIHLAAAARDPKQRSVARERWYGVLPRKGAERPTSPHSQGKHFPNMATHGRAGRDRGREGEDRINYPRLLIVAP